MMKKSLPLNKWVSHVLHFRAAHPGMSLTTAFKKARPSYYKKVGKKSYTPETGTLETLTVTEKEAILQALAELDFKALRHYLKSKSRRMKQIFGDLEFSEILDTLCFAPSAENRDDLLRTMGITKGFEDFMNQTVTVRQCVKRLIALKPNSRV